MLLLEYLTLWVALSDTDKVVVVIMFIVDGKQYLQI